ncbi:MAG: hypothetical protein M3Q71_07440 [Chloroflexota bacterium]|nr:hypothetical protein [Chloroflexota bacterium]MDP9470486.1 hypothetical protein [Chloroflexota bacterium]
MPTATLITGHHATRDKRDEGEVHGWSPAFAQGIISDTLPHLLVAAAGQGATPAWNERPGTASPAASRER